ncbi:hypothetical protein JHK82_043599 [Glycine max]|nr:hypothetical protein JHK86_043486 [Glycine max]KAG5106629.1 hypothetical protein JHK82_043599 [Glycine max]KAG5117557.1 hypothetical protein JHK84_043670 [Glycine max]
MYNLGVAYGEMLKFDMGKLDVATSMIEKAIIANPTYAEAYNNIGLDISFWCVKLDGGLVGEGGDAVERLVVLIRWSIDDVMEVKGGDAGICCMLRLGCWRTRRKEMSIWFDRLKTF